MFKRMLSAFGVGGPTVDTVLDAHRVVPGQLLTGQVRIQGGSQDAEIGQVVVSLVTRVEVEGGDQEVNRTVEFQRVVVRSGVRVAAGQLLAMPFQLPIHWETPISAVGPSMLPGVTVGVRTELVIAGAPDPGDLDPVTVHPLPSQERVLDAFGQLGFAFRRADVEAGYLHGVRQQLGFFQEIEFLPPHRFAGRINEVELTFVASPQELVVVLEADKRGGLLRAGGDAFGRFAMTHQQAAHTDWAPLVEQWLAQVVGRGGAGFGGPSFGGPAGFGGHPGHPGQPYHPGQPGQPYHPGHHGHPGHRGHGGAGMAGGLLAGVAGGMVLGEVFDEVGDAFEGEE